MHNKFPPLPVRILVVVIVLSAILYFGFKSLNPADAGQLSASGTIESVTLNISPEISGKVKQVLVGEGQSVKAGDALLILDDSLISAQRAVSSAQLDSAKAGLSSVQSAYATAQEQYETTLSNALTAEKSARTAVWKESKPSEFDQPVWYFSQAERIQAAQADVAASEKILQDAQAKLEKTKTGAGSAQFLTVESALIQARAAFQNAQDVFDLTSGASDSQTLRDSAQVLLDEAEINLEDAQKDYDDELSTDDAKDVLEARADVVIAQEIYDAAVDKLRALQTGEYSQAVMTAGKALDQAKAAMEQAEAGVKTAEANLALLDIQLKKLTIYAPMDGVILTRNVEPGEFIQPGAVALTMANLDALTITVYVPDPRLNEVKLGQKANVTIDFASGESPVFSAEVIYISDQAEFTPRNVQTVEGRSGTVFAIKLKVTNIDDLLKIGMPADVIFSR